MLKTSDKTAQERVNPSSLSHAELEDLLKNPQYKMLPWRLACDVAGHCPAMGFHDVLLNITAEQLVWETAQKMRLMFETYPSIKQRFDLGVFSNFGAEPVPGLTHFAGVITSGAYMRLYLNDVSCDADDDLLDVITDAQVPIDYKTAIDMYQETDDAKIARSLLTSIADRDIDALFCKKEVIEQAWKNGVSSKKEVCIIARKWGYRLLPHIDDILNNRALRQTPTSREKQSSRTPSRKARSSEFISSLSEGKEVSELRKLEKEAMGLDAFVRGKHNHQDAWKLVEKFLERDLENPSASAMDVLDAETKLAARYQLWELTKWFELLIKTYPKAIKYINVEAESIKQPLSNILAIGTPIERTFDETLDVMEENGPVSERWEATITVWGKPDKNAGRGALSSTDPSIQEVDEGRVFEIAYRHLEDAWVNLPSLESETVFLSTHLLFDDPTTITPTPRFTSLKSVLNTRQKALGSLESVFQSQQDRFLLRQAKDMDRESKAFSGEKAEKRGQGGNAVKRQGATKALLPRKRSGAPKM